MHPHPPDLIYFPGCAAALAFQAVLVIVAIAAVIIAAIIRVVVVKARVALAELLQALAALRKRRKLNRGGWAHPHPRNLIYFPAAIIMKGDPGAWVYISPQGEIKLGRPRWPRA